ncbi:MAG: phosphoglycerate kinase [Candidatus Njordarchaeales archaeon]
MVLEIPPIPFMDDYDLSEKKVLVRVDFNVPIDPKTGVILNDARIKAHARTIKELIDLNAAVVVISHQGRPGGKEFTSLKIHAERLSEILSYNVKFIDDIIGPAARNEIKKLKNAEVLVLENTRLISEEIIEAAPEKQAQTFFVKKLAPLFDAFVLDAFSTAHRSQPSLVGFPMVLPSVAGRVFEAEIKALSKIISREERPKVFVLGGAKVEDSLKVIETLVRNKAADRILTTGLLAEVFLVAKGINIGKENIQFLAEKGLIGLIPRARRLLMMGAPIETPYDVAIEKNGKRVEVPVTKVNGRIMDIGTETIKSYIQLMNDAKIIVLRGPAGVIEKGSFKIGTIKLAEAALRTSAFTIFGGGHFTVIADELDEKLRKKIGHRSLAGGALLLFLAGERLPAIYALAESAKKFIWRR